MIQHHWLRLYWALWLLAYDVPKFLLRRLPILKINSNFLIEQVEVTTQSITAGGGTVKTVVCDGNCTKQAFLKRYETVKEKPSQTKYGVFLLFDFVHLLKNYRNLWLTKKMGELVNWRQWRTENYKMIWFKIALWVRIKDISISLVPKPTEPQKVSTCYHV